MHACLRGVSLRCSPPPLPFKACLELRDGLREAVDLVGDLLGGGLAARVVELDAPVLLCVWETRRHRGCAAGSGGRVRPSKAKPQTLAGGAQQNTVASKGGILEPHQGRPGCATRS